MDILWAAKNETIFFQKSVSLSLEKATTQEKRVKQKDTFGSGNVKGSALFSRNQFHMSPSQWGTSFKKKSKIKERFQAYTQSVMKFLVVGKKRFSSILLEN